MSRIMRVIIIYHRHKPIHLIPIHFHIFAFVGFSESPGYDSREEIKARGK
jgi:hypothetical protein